MEKTKKITGKYFKSCKLNSSINDNNENFICIVTPNMNDHDIFCRLFKYAIISRSECAVLAYTNNINITLAQGDCMVNTKTLEVVKENLEENE